MKIAVIGYTRTGSTKLAMVLARVLKVEFLSEILSDLMPVDEQERILAELAKKDNYCVKLMSHHLSDRNIGLIDWSKFDLVVATSRESNLDAFISFAIAIDRAQWIKRKEDDWVDTPFAIDFSHFTYWFRNIFVRYQTVIPILESYRGKIPCLSYADIVDDARLIPQIKTLVPNIDDSNLEFSLVPTHIDYRTKCTNYKQLEVTFKELGLA